MTRPGSGGATALARIAAAAVVIAGCGHDRPPPSPPPSQEAADPVSAALARVQGTDRRVAVLIFDPARGDRVREFAGFFPGDFSFDTPAVLSLDSSRSRALAARFHPSTTRPTIVYLTPAGVIVGRAEGTDPAPPWEAKQVVEVDRRYADLRAAAAARAADVPARMALADFLLSHENDREAVPLLRSVADDADAPLPARVRAWVELARAHLWVGEPEKARHAAQALIADLGPRTPEAVAGGNLVRGLQDANAKRDDRARAEFDAAAAAAPASPYAAEAMVARDKLPQGKP